MKIVEPEVRLIAKPNIDWAELSEYLKSVGVDAKLYAPGEVEGRPDSWFEERFWKENGSDAEMLVEVGGKVCYRSWEPGLNPNVTKVRTDQGEYLENILRSGHGSVLEHAQFTFTFRHVSRVLTHELARHRAGTAISQESMRYVRLDDIPVWLPEWAQQDEFVLWLVQQHVRESERLMSDLAEYFKLDEPETPFHEKKAKTSFMRRFAPGGGATDMVWSANIRALRHIIELRTDPSAEEEIRLVFGKVAEIMKAECPALFADFTLCTDGSWRPTWRKV